MKNNKKLIRIGKYLGIAIIIGISFFLGAKYGIGFLLQFNKKDNSQQIDYVSLRQKFLKLKADNQLLSIWGIRSGSYNSSLFPNRYYICRKSKLKLYKY